MAMIGAVESGLGHTVLPYGAVRASLEAGKVSVSHLTNPGLRRALYLTQSTDRVPTRAARAIADIVRKQALALDAESAWRPADGMLAYEKS
jgi:DNA-binding transcriptional LysR family regulator